MNYSSVQYRYIALAAVTQSAQLVDALAETGHANSDDMAACLEPLFVMDPRYSAEVYPSVHALNPGLRILQEIFSNQKSERNNEIARYTLGMLALRNRLMADNRMQDLIRKRLESMIHSEEFQNETTSGSLDWRCRQLADLYQNTVSGFSFRIHVKGKVEFLKDETIACRIRALLLAGIRSAVLWYQLGGRRWHLLIYRNQVRQSVTEIRRSLISTV